MLRKTSFLTLAVSVVLLSVGMAVAAGPDVDIRLAKSPVVIKESNGLFIDAPLAFENFVVMNVRVYNQNSELVFNYRSFGERVNFFVNGQLPDGEYRYEVVCVLDISATVEPGNNVDTERAVRNLGYFTIYNGEITEEDRPGHKDLSITPDETSLLDNVLEQVMHLAGTTLDILISSTHAANLSASSDLPRVSFDDTDNTARTHEWTLRAPGGTQFTLVDLTNANTVIEIDSSANNFSSMKVDSAGDIHWANGTMNLDKSSSTLSLGWSSTLTEMSISSVTPDIRLHDETGTQEAEWELSNDLVTFFGRPSTAANWNAILQYNVNAPTNSIGLDSSGDINFAGNRFFMDRSSGSFGIGTNTPDATLEIRASSPSIQLTDDSLSRSMRFDYAIGALFLMGDQGNIPILIADQAPDYSLALSTSGNLGIGTSTPTVPIEVERTDTAKILVKNITTTEAPRELFEISNAGNTKFIITNTQAIDGSSWGFTNNGDDFRISYQGSGVVEMQVFEGGNVNIVGTLTEDSDRAAKANIETIDSNDVLDKVIGLPITRWQYKTSEGVDHMGPMAQDFYSAFGLGDTDKGIASLDSGGVALASIQALANENQQLRAQNLSLEQRLHTLEAERHHQQTGLERLSKLEEVVSGLLADQSEQLASH